MRRVVVITTCSLKGWNEYGYKMHQSFLKHWRCADLLLYSEDRDVSDLPIPKWYKEFKIRHHNNADAHGMASGKYNFRRDCVRFGHKVAALTDGAFADYDRVIWCDADVVTDADVEEAEVARWLPGDKYASLLLRPGTYPECGFMVFDRRHHGHTHFMNELRRTYETDYVFRLKETHDSFVIWKLLLALGYPIHDLTGKAKIVNNHPVVVS